MSFPPLVVESMFSVMLLKPTLRSLREIIVSIRCLSDRLQAAVVGYYTAADCLTLLKKAGVIESSLTLCSIKIYLSCPVLQKERHQACTGEFCEFGEITRVKNETRRVLKTLRVLQCAHAIPD